MELNNCGTYSEGKLCCVELYVYLVCGLSISPVSSPKKKLTLLLQFITKASGKELYVRITDNSDSLVLFTCSVTENDYHSLKQNQGLLVDFPSFPQKVVELVQMCINEENNEKPRFVLVLRTTEAIEHLAHTCTTSSNTLEIVEVNIFKHLCHLSLVLKPSTVQMKLEYLSEVILLLKTEKEELFHLSSDNDKQLQSKCCTLQEQLALKAREIEQLRENIAKSSVEASEKQEWLLSQERQKLIKVQSDADRRLERERRELETRMVKQVDDLQAKVKALNQQTHDLLEKKRKSENSIKELNERLSTREAELERYHENILHLEKQTTIMERDLHSKQSYIRELESRVSFIEGDLKSKNVQLQSALQNLEAVQRLKGQLEESLAEKKAKCEKRESSITQVYAELRQSLNVIQKLQKKIQEEQFQNKVRATALTEQEKVMTQKDSQICDLQKKLEDATSKFDQLTLTQLTQEKELQQCKEKLEEHKKTLKTNENVISWLNRQLNEIEVGGGAKRAPLSDIYLGAVSHSTSPGSGVAHSTPLSFAPLVNLEGLNRISCGVRANVASKKRIPQIPEEISPYEIEDGKENCESLPEMYIKNSQKHVTSSGGLLRDSGFVNSDKNQKDVAETNKLLKDSCVNKLSGRVGKITNAKIKKAPIGKTVKR